MNRENRYPEPDFIPVLLALKTKGKQEEFNEKLIHALPQLRRYVARALNAAVHHGLITASEMTVDAVVDDIYIKAYEEIEQLDLPDLFDSWLLLKAEEVLQDRLDEKEYDKLYLTDLAKYSKQEWDKMEEKYSVDGGGDFVTMDELDDPSYSTPEYKLEDVFKEDTEAELIEHLDKELTAEDSSRHIAMVVKKLPMPIRTTFELYVRHGRNETQIAQLRNVALQEVQAQLNEARILLRQSFGTRFLGWKAE